MGNTGLQVSRLAFGTGTNGYGGHSDQSALGTAGLADLLLSAFDAGVNFWDTADAYGTHPHLARALGSVDRDQVVILTKTMSRDPKRVSQDVDRYRRELDSDILDIVLLHSQTSADWTARYKPAMEALTRAKEDGKVRAVGVSCHSLPALQAAASSGWAEVVMARINYADLEMDAPPARVVPALAQLHAAGIVVVGMKVLGAGRLGGEVEAAIEYVFNLGTVQAVTIGMTDRKQLVENIRAISSMG